MTGAVFLDRHVDAAAVRAEVRDHVHIDFGMLGVDAVEHFLRQNAHLGPAHGAVVVFDLGAGDLGIFFRGPVGAVPVVGEGDGLGRAVVAALGAQVTVAARRPAQRALAESFSLRAVDLARLEQAAPAFDTVVNTIPAPVLTEAVLAALRPGSLIVDLAAKPGGTDFAAARRLGHRAIHALSLPPACAPETAGEALARTVCEILAEREETP